MPKFGLLVDYVMFIMCLLILISSLYISFKMKFVQLRFFPYLLKLIQRSFKKNSSVSSSHTILPYKALFTAMSTTLGIGSIVGPIVAIRWGGPGALVGFLLTAFFGSAVTYTEVGLCVKYRGQKLNGEIEGGPMQYLKQIFSPFIAKWYAFFGCIVMTAWSSAQANQLGAILDSPLLGNYRLSSFVSGTILTAVILFTLLGGIKRVSSFSSKLVPMMFTLYVGASSLIILAHLAQLPAVLSLIIQSMFTPYSLVSGAAIGGVTNAMRWGIFKGVQVTEAGVGTQTIPHSMAQTDDPIAQGMLAMVSTYTAGLVAFISGLVVLLTDTWQSSELPLGISMMAASFQLHFSYLGVGIIVVSTALFAFGTILGNSFNGSQCFQYIASSKSLHFYYLAMAAMIFWGTISEVELVWSFVDIALLLLVIPHMAALICFAYHRSSELLLPLKKENFSL